METHYASVALADQNLEINIGSQCLDKVQRGVAHCLGVPHASRSVKSRRLGGGFGGKATRPTWLACAAAIASKLTRKNCSMHFNLEDCITIMGGRSIYKVNYKASFESTGKCTAVDLTLYCDTGACPNDNGFAGMLFCGHGDGPYSIKNYRYNLILVRTAHPSVTWLRAPGMLQAAFAIERVIDHGLRKFKIDQANGRAINLARPGDTT